MENLKQHLVDTWPLYVYASAFIIGALRVWLP
ncbi:DNA primase/helicase [Klebsiella phage vB_KpnP-VAC71]|uniref:DNA primase/helicase n=1 Tax=Klebsiella phage vB_KpnP-VAC71 TaxID=2866700 RepID=A0AAE9C5Z5_9CAUD|nr:DNA primase/helicase [Klebsiella phage vB_KpnP-VAC71]